MPPQLREIGCHVENHATQWRDFQHEIQFQEIGMAWIQLTHYMVEVVPVPSQARRACRAYTSKDSVVLGLDSSHGTDS